MPVAMQPFIVIGFCRCHLLCRFHSPSLSLSCALFSFPNMLVTVQQHPNFWLTAIHLQSNIFCIYKWIFHFQMFIFFGIFFIRSLLRLSSIVPFHSDRPLFPRSPRSQWREAKWKQFVKNNYKYHLMKETVDWMAAKFFLLQLQFSYSSTSSLFVWFYS